MFNKVCIKSKELNNQKIDISFLVETMLFYGNVIVLAHKEEIKTLLYFFGEDMLEELIISGRIDLRIRENILGLMIFPGDRYNIDLVHGQGSTYSSILYEAHREIIKNSAKNSAFSDKFSKIVIPHNYGGEITNQIRNDFDNRELLLKMLPLYLKSIVPTYEIPHPLEIEILKDTPFESFESYSLNTNIDIKEINGVLEQN